MGNEEFDIAELAKKLMSDPAAIEMVNKLKESGAAGQLENTAKETAEEAENSDVSEDKEQTPQDVTGKLPDIIGMLSPLMGKSTKHGNAETEKRNRLLAALKPYLNDSRRGMIDAVMSLSQITDLLDQIPKGKQQ